MILKLLDFQQLFKIEMAFILTYLIDFTTRTGLQGRVLIPFNVLPPPEINTVDLTI